MPATPGPTRAPSRRLFPWTLVSSAWKTALVVFTLLAGLELQAGEPERSVVQIFVFSQQPIWDAPWRFDSVRRASGTGFVIKGKRIVTNAHVVSWARQILIKRYQDPRPYPARVVHIGHDCDLAILEVEEDRFFEGVQPLPLLADLPKVRSAVVTYGYPAGGEQISYTKGVVSRIEMQTYVHAGNRSFLTVQTDAAINPGNSGGPVIQDDQVVGVAFQGTPGLENTGFFIPTPVVQHFLKDAEDGSYHGFPQAGVRLVPLQNPAYRLALGLPDNDAGARVDSILPIESTTKLLRQDDVLLEVAGFPVASDGTVIYSGNRVFLAVAFQTVQHRQSVPLKLWRDRKEIALDLPVFTYEADRPQGNQHDVLPRYLVYGGLVFTPLSLDYLKTFGRNWSDSANAELVYELFYRPIESPKTTRKEPVVLASVLAHPANANIKVQGRVIVDRINGTRINSLEDVAQALDQRKDPFHVIEFLPNRSIETLSRSDGDKATPEILKAYNIPSDRRL